MKKHTSSENLPVMTRDEVRSIDRWAINEIGIAGVVLMENAGRSCAELIIEKLSNIADPKVCIFCGTGNNGGDGYVIARHLLNSGLKVSVVICGDRDRIKGDAKINLTILEKLGQRIEKLTPGLDNIESIVEGFTAKADMLVDAIFGTGLQGNLTKEYVELIEAINSQQKPILAVDIPSGLECDSGKPLGTAIIANYTVSFVAVKKGFNNPNAHKYTSEVFVASIGIEPSAKR